MREWWSKLRATLGGRRGIADDLREEMDAHLELEIEDKLSRGMTPEAARRQFGNRTLIQERAYEAWSFRWLESLLQDLRYAFRNMRNSPSFAVTAVLSLALGIGANTAIFSLIDALLLRWLPIRDPQQLVQLTMTLPDTPRPTDSFSYPVVQALADQREIFSGACGFSGAAFHVGPPEDVKRTPGAWVTGAYYETFGLVPVAGRLLTRDDDRPGAALVAVITDGYWERSFGRDPGVIGRTILIESAPVTIAGVSPAGFNGANVGSVADITVPLAALAQLTPQNARLLEANSAWLRVLARPRPGITIVQAQARLAAVWPPMASVVVTPQTPARRRAALLNSKLNVIPGGTGWSYLRQQFQKPLLVLMALVGVVLLIACANAASLLLARATARQREIAVRLAIGAGRSRLVRQLLTESILLASIAATLGVVLAWFGSRFIVDLLSSGGWDGIQFDLTPNWHVLLFTCTVSLGTGILFGILPALRATSGGPALAFKDNLGKTAGSRTRAVSSLVTAQVALSLLLLIGAGLFVRTLRNLQGLNTGFRSEGVLLVDLDGRRAGYRDARLTALYRELLQEIERLAGVASASLSNNTPLSGMTWSEPVVVKGQPRPQNETAHFTAVAPRYFETMRLPLVLGRDFTIRDDASAPVVAVVNQAFVQRFFPAGSPLGQHVSGGRGPLADIEIAGVVKDAVSQSLRAAPPPTVYVSYFQMAPQSASFEIRVAGSLAQVSSAIRNVVQQKLPGTPVEVRTLASQVERTLVQERLMATLAGSFGVLALVLASVGLYGLLSYTAARRTSEIGIRMALGAKRGQVLRMVIKDAVRLLAFGVVLGLPTAWAASRLVSSMLFGLTPNDTTTIAGATALLILSGLLAGFLPAFRASRVDPVVALRYE